MFYTLKYTLLFSVTFDLNTVGFVKLIYTTIKSYFKMLRL